MCVCWLFFCGFSRFGEFRGTHNVGAYFIETKQWSQQCVILFCLCVRVVWRARAINTRCFWANGKMVCVWFGLEITSHLTWCGAVHPRNSEKFADCKTNQSQTCRHGDKPNRNMNPKWVYEFTQRESRESHTLQLVISSGGLYSQIICFILSFLILVINCL